MCHELWLVWRFLGHRWTRYVASWLFVLGLAAHLQNIALHEFDWPTTQPPEKQRRDGNNGHTTIDFGGQWVMGRMVASGHGRDLYDMRRQYEIIQSAYPYSDEAPKQEKHDADDLLEALIEADDTLRPRTRETMQTFAAPLMAGDALQAAGVAAVCQDKFWTDKALGELNTRAVGGPLYPPIQALAMAPLARNHNPHDAYRLMQWFVLAMAFIAGLGFSVLTRGRIWWPVATTIILLYPGFKGGHDLAQNPAVTLAIVVWGWALIARGFPTGGGMIWGLLAFKPTWAMAFFLIPVLTRRWRTCLAMLAMGVGLAAITLPFVGLHSWFDWLKIGKAANHIYDVDANWIPLSRDLFGLPRRLWIDTRDSIPYTDRDRWYAHVAGWAIWLFVLETTVKFSQLYRRRLAVTSGPQAAFILLAAWLLCLHFMYYDALISAAAVLLLLDPPARLFRPLLVTFRSASDPEMQAEPDADYFQPLPAATHPELSGYRVRGVAVANSFVMYLFATLLVVQHTLPWMHIGATFSMGRLFKERPEMSAGEPVVRDGKTVMHTPKLELPLASKNPPLDTLILLGLWGWCGVQVILDKPEASQKEADNPKR